MSDNSRAAKIRALNDELRCRHSGGQIMLTHGIQALGSRATSCILRAVAKFDAFTPDNDPHGEHDCALLDWRGYRILFKLDYYDPEMPYGSDDPADPTITVRVLTIMLAEEY